MKKNVTFGFLSILLVVLMCLANVPTVSAHVSPTALGDPLINPTEIAYAVN